MNSAVIQFIPGNGVVYRLNPLTKGLVCGCAVLFFTVLGRGWMPLLGTLLILSLCALFFSVKQSLVWISVKRISLLMIIVGGFQGFKSGAFIWQDSLEAVLRIIGVFFSAGLYLTVSPQSELLYFSSKLLAPLGWFGLPSNELALIMVIALRFFPVMLSEIERIKIAQTARGANLKKGGIISSAAALMPLLIPTLMQALIRADELALAMEARGYNTSLKRTEYRSFSFAFKDFLFISISALVLTFIVMTGINS